MTINLSRDLEISIESIVHSGRFASVDEAMAEAARRLIQDLKQASVRKEVFPDEEDLDRDPLLGCMRDDGDLMDEIVVEAYRQRAVESWRDIDL